MSDTLASVLQGRHPVKGAVINLNTISNHTIVSGVAGKRIVVTSIVLNITLNQTVEWKSGTTAISGVMVESYAIGNGKDPVLMCAEGENLVIATTTTDNLDGHITYCLFEG